MGELEVGIGAEDEAFSSEEDVLYNENMQPREDRFISQEEWNASIKLAQQYNPELFENMDDSPEPQIEESQAASQFAKNLSDEINKKVETFADSEDTEENREKDWENMTVALLKAELRKRKLKVSGRKKELIQRLKDSKL